jgi:AraC-like DNA-binding protein
MSQLGRSAGLTGFIDVAREAGLDPYALARTAGIPREALTDPELRVAVSAMSRLIELAASAAGLEDFALRMVEKRRLSTMGPMGLAIREQPNLRKALELFHQYAWLQNEALSVGLEEVDDLALLRLGMPAWRGRQASELAMGVIFRMVQAVRGPTWRPLEVRFMHAAPANLDGHHRLFGLTPLFDQDFMGLVIDRAELDRPVLANDPEMARVMEDYIAHLAQGKGRLTLSAQVQQLILSLLPGGGCTVERVASRLGMDRRTLHRRLAGEGRSFTELLNATRAELAGSLLATSERPLQSVADMLGFASLSAFAHWFRRNFECTASAYRLTRSAPTHHAAALIGASSGSRIT